MSGDDGSTPKRVAHEIETLRDYRNRPDRSVDMARDLARLARTYAQAGNGLGELAGIWQELVPSEVRESARLLRISRGVLTITVENSSERFLLDRALRGGLRRELVRRSKVSLRDVRVLIASPKKDG